MYIYTYVISVHLEMPRSAQESTELPSGLEPLEDARPSRLGCQGAVGRSSESCRPLEPREGEPRQPNKAYSGLLVAIGPLLGLIGLGLAPLAWAQMAYVTEEVSQYGAKMGS